MLAKSAFPQLRVGAKSHPGKVRTENQDRMGRFPSPFGELFIVADGMGGHQGGALAATMTTDGFEKYLRLLSSNVASPEALQQAAQRINAEIYQKANSGDPAVAKMGSTIVLALINGSQLLVGHAGDSRAYLFRNGRLTRLTRDHSAVQKMIEHHMLTEEEAREHPDASVINRAFGQKPEIELEVSSPLTIQLGDGLLLCTDGLCGYVDDAEIERAVVKHDDAQKITDALVDLALRAGGEDNVTVQFLQFGPRAAAVVGEPLENRAMSHAAAGPVQPGAVRRKSNLLNYTIIALIFFALGYLAVNAAGFARRWWKGSGGTPTVSPTPQPPAGEGAIEPSQQTSPSTQPPGTASPTPENRQPPPSEASSPSSSTPTATASPKSSPAASPPKPTIPQTVESGIKKMEEAVDSLRNKAETKDNKTQAAPGEQKPPDAKPGERPGNRGGAGAGAENPVKNNAGTPTPTPAKKPTPRPGTARTPPR